jgi:hypothetical protein
MMTLKTERETFGPDDRETMTTLIDCWEVERCHLATIGTTGEDGGTPDAE